MKSIFALIVLFISATSSAHPDICFLQLGSESVNSVKYNNTVDHRTYELSVNNSITVRYFDVTPHCDAPNTLCPIESKVANSALPNLEALALQLQADGTCRSVVNNIR